ncbi:unnamed protein product, partial [marine sediment metagenome]
DYLRNYWLRVKRGGPDECWEWLADKNGEGYGRIQRLGKPYRAHRVAWELANGPIPEGMYVLHHCDNPACVNPRHLWLGTHLDNARDRNSKGRQASGETHGQAKLTETEVLAIRKDKRSQRVLGKLYSVSDVQIGRIKRGVRWAWLRKEKA